MRKYLLSAIILVIALLGNQAFAQLTNNGATIKVSAGAQLVCNGDLTNTSGTIDNDGTLDVKGSFTNNGTYLSTSGSDVLSFSGTGNVTLKGGTSTYRSLVINKTSGGGVKLTGNFNLTNSFTLTAGSFSTDPENSYEFIAPTSASFSFAPGTEIIGKVRRTGWVNGTSYAFNSANMLLTTNGGTAPTSILVTMVPGGDPTAAQKEVKRKFLFTQTGGAGYTADVTLPYSASELNTNIEGSLVPWYYSTASSEWIAKTVGNTLNTTSDFITTTGISASTFENIEWKLADRRHSFNLTARLRGAWNGTVMTTSLNGGGVLPLAHPYNVTPFNYTGTESVTAIPNASVVDWVLVELRKPASGLAADAGASTIIGRKVGFLLNNATIVDTDGTTPISFDVDKQGTAFVVVRHRNHLGVMSNAVLASESGVFTNDFTVLSNSYKDANAASDPVVLLTNAGGYGLWAGDANRNGIINSGDMSAVKLAISNSLSGYQFTDTNLTGTINATDDSLVRNTISTSGSGSTPARSSVVRVKKIKSNLPETITE